LAALRLARRVGHIWWAPRYRADGFNGESDDVVPEIRTYVQAVRAAMEAQTPPYDGNRTCGLLEDLLFLAEVARSAPVDEADDMGVAIDGEVFLMLDRVTTLPLGVHAQQLTSERPAAMELLAALLDSDFIRSRAAVRMRRYAWAFLSTDAREPFARTRRMSFEEAVANEVRRVDRFATRPWSQRMGTAGWRQWMGYADAIEVESWRQAGETSSDLRGLYSTEVGLYASDANAVKSHFTSLALRRLAAVKLACALYAADHGGEAPASLEALVPEYLSKVPADPFAEGKPLGYRGGSEAFVWSVGPNGRDDVGSGAFVPTRDDHAFGPNLCGDGQDLVCFLHVFGRPSESGGRWTFQ
jgi:hypothetical protein